jgi:Family of unknown function (DUF6444)
VSNGLDPTPLPEGLGVPTEEGHQPPVRVRLVMLPLLKRLATLAVRLPQHSSNSRRPPSTDTPATKRHRRMPAAERQPPGGQPGQAGHPQVRVDPTVTVALCPEGYSWGPRAWVELTPYHPHPVMDLPALRPDVTHWRLHHGRGVAGGNVCTAPRSSEQGSG